MEIVKQWKQYRELVWVLARTDFKLRYQGSVLGYVWALLKPLLMFTIMYLVFSSVFNMRNDGTNYYGLELLIGIMMFNFFSEGTTAGLDALIRKYQLVTKIYVPRWTIIVASTINAAMIYITNLIIIVVFFWIYHLLPTAQSLVLFACFSIVIYIITVSFSLIMAPLQVMFRDIALIWEVLVQVLFYASPIMYPLSMMPPNMQKIILMNPIAFIVHFTKEALITGRLPELYQTVGALTLVAIAFVVGVLVYQKLIPSIAEKM